MLESNFAVSTKIIYISFHHLMPTFLKQFFDQIIIQGRAIFFQQILFAPTVKLWFWCFHRNYFPATICTFQIFPSGEVSSYTYPRRAVITPKHSVPRKSIDRAIGNLVETLFRIVSLCRGGLHLWRGRGISSGWPMKLMMADGT